MLLVGIFVSESNRMGDKAIVNIPITSLKTAPCARHPKDSSTESQLHLYVIISDIEAERYTNHHISNLEATCGCCGNCAALYSGPQHPQTAS